MREKRHLCSVEGCGKCYDRPAKLLAHIRSTHTGERPFECQEANCFAKFHRKKELTVHMLKHLPPDQKPFKCDTCGKGHNTRQHLDLHIKNRHSPSPPMVCELCKQEFVHPANYKNHVGAHAQCTQCSKVFRNETKLQVHVAKHHAKQYSCLECRGVVFDTYTELSSHVSAQHPRPVKKLVPAPPTIEEVTGQLYQRRELTCPHQGCARRFTRRYDLERHVISAHSESSVPTFGHSESALRSTVTPAK